MHRLTREALLKIKLIHFAFFGLAILISAMSFNTLASPTESDFEPCVKIAVKSLSHCLALKPNNKREKVNELDNNCWQSSKKNYDVCLTRVLQRYNPDVQKRKQAEQQRIEEVNK